ncbi:MAG: FMN-binding glutamate synthase family protein [Bacteroidota bacterium]
MFRNLKGLSIRAIIILAFFSLNIFVLTQAIYTSYNWFWIFPLTIGLFVVVLFNSVQQKHTLLYNFPLLGYFRYFLESIRPELRQYFWESDLDGKPFNRRQRSIVYQRAKNERQTVAFGMQEDPNAPGYEWVAHSVFPTKLKDRLRVKIGNDQCRQPYDASILNIGAMSYGALSKTAIASLNEGAKLGRFAHNTGEGGISDYHLQGGDLIWQIGTGYFGCRDAFGKFSSSLFKETAALENIKMIELKLSQGAKPGHGGILPASKNTVEIAAIRNVVPHTTVYSPPGHSCFGNAIEMIRFVGFLRTLSEGKPVGFKLCIGNKQEFIRICEAINITGIIPDFITIDGAEGGTGAAPLEFTDHIGMPLYDALVFVTQTLNLFGLKGKIALIAAGKIITAFDMMKLLALGASACYSARAMMFSLGCIQALKCDSGHCPAGIATQNESLYKGLKVTDKRVRVANYHRNTLEAVAEMMDACGFERILDIKPDKFFRKIDQLKTKSFKQLYFDQMDGKLKENWFKANMLN